MKKGNKKMKENKYFKRLMTFAIATIMCLSTLTILPTVSAATINVPDDYSTIQAAIDAANPGDTIIVAAGIYDEQVVIDKALTLQGVGDTTIIRPSDEEKLTKIETLPWISGGTKTTVSIVWADAPGQTVVIKDLKVDGTNVDVAPSSNPGRIAGIAYNETSGTVENVTVVEMCTPTMTPRSVGIWTSDDDASTTSSVEVKYCNVTNYNRGGIYGCGDYLTINFNHNNITGPGVSGVQVPNGIFILAGTVGSATYNTVSACGYSGPDYRGTGIGTYDAANNIVIAHNTITDLQNAVALHNSHFGTVEYNTITDSHTGVRLETGADNNTIQYNTIENNTYAIRCSYVLGDDNTAHYNNFINNTGTGMTGYEGAVSHYDDGTGPKHTLDARYNYWDHVSGPYHPTTNPTGQGNSVGDNVDYEPWYQSSDRWAGMTHTMEVTSPPTKLTTNSYYERSESIVKDGSGNYWMFYGRSWEDTGHYGNCNPDDCNYNLYYKKATSIPGLASASANQVGSVNNVYQGQTSSVYYDSKVWVFYTDDLDNIWYFTTTDGSSWTGPTDTGFDGYHQWTTVYDSKIFLAYTTSSAIKVATYDGSSWSTSVDATDHEGMPRFYEDSNSDLYLIWCSWGKPAYYIHTYDGGWSTTPDYSIRGTALDDCDPTLTQIDGNGDYILIFAPWDSSVSKQYLASWTASNLAGLDDVPAFRVTDGGYGSTNWVDMWPITFVDGSDVYLFYSSERDGTSRGTGNIWYMELDWNTNNNHYTYIQNAIDAATGTTINIATGTYDEQVVIDKSLTLQGAGDSTIIKPSSHTVLTSLYTLGTQTGAYWNGNKLASIISVDNVGTAGVAIKDLKVDGENVDSTPSGANYIVGISYGETSGVIDDVTVVNMNTSSGSPRSYGIWLDAVSTDVTVEVKNSDIKYYNKNGINVRGAKIFANIHDNDQTITGPGAIVTEVPNGILLINDADGTISNNIILGNKYTGATWKSSGVLLYLAADYITIQGNTIYDCDDCVLLHGTDYATIQNNMLNDSYTGVLFETSSYDNIVQYNNILNNDHGIRIYADSVIGNEAHYNNIIGNTNGTTNFNTTQTFDAEYNYWGDALGPGNESGSSGDPVWGLVDYDPWIGSDPPWSVQLDFEDTNGKTDYIVFGEKMDASDGQDSYDVPKPGIPPIPYLYAWFNAGLSEPYDRLWKDYRFFPDGSKVWDFNVTCNTTTRLGDTTITISWDKDDINSTEYNHHIELWNDTEKVADMKAVHEYSIDAEYSDFPLEHVYHFQIKCDVNDPPVANDDYATVAEGGTVIQLDGGATSVLANDTDAEGDSLTAVLNTGPSHASSFTLNSDGSFVYVHDGSETTSDSFTYKANDGIDDSNVATVHITITPVNDPPTSVDAEVTTDEDIQYVFQTSDFPFNDVDGDTFEGIKVTTLENVGDLRLNGVDVTLDQEISATDIDDGNLTYDPLPDEFGDDYDSFGFKVYDGTVYSTSAYTMTIDVNAVNDDPVANDDYATVNENSTDNQIDVLINDSDIDGDSLIIDGVSTPMHGSTSTDGFYVNYTPDPGFNGSDSFTYWMRDDNGSANVSATVYITVLNLHHVSIKTNWNLISIPFYEDIDKTEIIVRNNSICYNWTTAVSEGIILNFTYKWNTATGYGDTSTLEPGFGYWMWAYYDCELLIPSNAVGTGDITDLEQKWNIMGLPYNESLDKGDVIVHYNGDDYTWDEAVQNNIILGFIYGWDRTNQIYILSDTFDPGDGYWMYAYYDCTLKKS